jgi:hypothetical protein
MLRSSCQAFKALTRRGMDRTLIDGELTLAADVLLQVDESIGYAEKRKSFVSNLPGAAAWNAWKQRNAVCGK